MRKTNIIAILLVVFSFVLGFYFYPQLPDELASHWNASGQVDGYMPKFFGIFMIPFMLGGLFLLFLIIPKVDPLKANLEKFRKYFDLLILFILFFLFYIYCLLLAWNMGFNFEMNYALLPAMGLLFIFIGFMLEKARRNWFVGIRTPWTLSSDTVWDKTHKKGSKLFKIAGIIAIAGVFFGEHSVFVVIIPVLLFTIYLVVFSYFEYQKEMKK